MISFKGNNPSGLKIQLNEPLATPALKQLFHPKLSLFQHTTTVSLWAVKLWLAQDMAQRKYLTKECKDKKYVWYVQFYF